MAGLSAARILTRYRPVAANRYELIRSRSSALEFHRRQVGEPVRSEIWWHDVTGAAIVLGSTQGQDAVDVDACRGAGFDIVRRRSGGGGVLLVPDEVVWVDVILPAGAPGWSDDIHGPMVWLGQHFAEVVRGLLSAAGGEADLEVHEAKAVTTRWSRLLCFDGIGSGEVLLGGRKLIGISQRRTRTYARLQCCWYSGYDQDLLVSLLMPEYRPPVSELHPVATLARSVALAIPEALLHRLNQQR